MVFLVLFNVFVYDCCVGHCKAVGGELKVVHRMLLACCGWLLGCSTC